MLQTNSVLAGLKNVCRSQMTLVSSKVICRHKLVFKEACIMHYNVQ